MSDKKYDNSGILFENDRKQKESQPDFKGSITVAGIDYWLSGWTKQGQKGEFTSLAVTPKEQKGDKYELENQDAKRNEPDNKPVDEDNLPF